MNVYFWLFSLYALLITPVTFHVQIRAGHELRYRLRVQIAGIPFLKKCRQEAPETRVKAGGLARKLLSADRRLAWELLRQGHLKRLFRTFQMEQIWIRLRVSFADAAGTAMAYVALRTVLQTVFFCRRSLPVQGRVEMDFEGSGTQLAVRCIVSARVGSLVQTGLRLLAAILRTRAELLRTKGDIYAAASH